MSNYSPFFMPDKYLYDSFCYPDLQSAADSFYSKGSIGNLIFQSPYVLSVDSVSFPVVYLDSNGNFVSKSFSYTFQKCVSLGHDVPFFGLGVEDAFLLSGAMVSLFIVAYNWRHLRDMIKGW